MLPAAALIGRLVLGADEGVGAALLDRDAVEIGSRRPNHGFDVRAVRRDGLQGPGPRLRVGDKGRFRYFVLLTVAFAEIFRIVALTFGGRASNF